MGTRERWKRKGPEAEAAAARAAEDAVRMVPWGTAASCFMNLGGRRGDFAFFHFALGVRAEFSSIARSSILPYGKETTKNREEEVARADRM